MIEIRFSDRSYGGEIDLSGSPEELRDVRQSILKLIQVQDRQNCIIEAEAIDPAPYDTCLNFLAICKSNSLLKVSVSANSLQVEGELNKLEIFADWFNFPDDTECDYHNHLDYFGNEWWVNPNSSSLIIAVKNSVKYL